MSPINYTPPSYRLNASSAPSISGIPEPDNSGANDAPGSTRSAPARRTEKNHGESQQSVIFCRLYNREALTAFSSPHQASQRAHNARQHQHNSRRFITPKQQAKEISPVLPEQRLIHQSGRQAPSYARILLG